MKKVWNYLNILEAWGVFSFGGSFFFFLINQFASRFGGNGGGRDFTLWVILPSLASEECLLNYGLYRWEFVETDLNTLLKM